MTVSEMKNELSQRVGEFPVVSCRKLLELSEKTAGQVDHSLNDVPAALCSSPKCFREPSDGQLHTALKIVSIISFALRDIYNFSLNNRQIVNSVLFWIPYVRADVWIPVLKARKDLLFATGTGQEELPEPWCTCCNNKYILPGSLGAALIQRSNCKKGPKALVFLNTLLHGIKKGMPTASKGIVKDSYKKHREVLSTPKGGIPAGLREAITRTSREIFGKMKFPDLRPSVIQKVTTKSTFDSSRREGGGLSEIFEDERSPLVHWGGCFTEETGPLNVSSNKDDALDKLEKIRTEVYDLLQQDSWENETCNWEAQAILEPLKVRMITAGELKWNGAWSDIQKSMFSKLSEFDQFKLTRGHSISSEDSITFQVAGDPKDPIADLSYVAGDFSRATDELKSDATQAALEGFGDETLRRLLTVNLMKGIIHYPEWTGLDAVRQMNGQLMGSIFSFPLLCVINLAVYRYTWEQRKGFKVPIDSLPVLINGDDIAFRTSKVFFEVWKGFTQVAGLIASVGKCYFTKKFFLVNSRLLKCDVQTGLIIGPVPYVNYGLVTGQKKGQQEEETPRSFRQKMANLEGSLKDLSKDFHHRDPIYLRSEERALRRRDIQLSQVSRRHLGLPQPGNGKDECSRFVTYERRVRRENRKDGGHTGLSAFVFNFPTIKGWRNVKPLSTDLVRFLEFFKKRVRKRLKRETEEGALVDVLLAQVSDQHSAFRQLCGVVDETGDSRQQGTFDDNVVLYYNSIVHYE
jgi:hypothetical protein